VDTSTCATCAGKGAGGRTGALLISPQLAQGSTDPTSYDHFSLLRTIEDSFGIPEHLNMAATANPMTAAFAGPNATPTLPETPLPLLLLLTAAPVGALTIRRARHRRARYLRPANNTDHTG